MNYGRGSIAWDFKIRWVERGAVKKKRLLHRGQTDAVYEYSSRSIEVRENEGVLLNLFHMVI